MKKQITLLLLLLAVVASVSAYDFTVSGIYYSKTGGNEVAVTFRNGDYNSYSGSKSIPSTVTYNSTEYSVTSIGDNAFRSCTGLTSVTIPSSVKKIGIEAFFGCTGLTSIIIPDKVTEIDMDVFGGCTNLASVTLSPCMDYIPDYMFNGCKSLTSFTIPDYVTTIGTGAFYGCTGLTTVTVPHSVTSIGNNAFKNCKAVTKLYWDSDVSPYCITEHCHTVLELAVMGPEITTIGPNAFDSCVKLTSISIPASVTSIGECAFYNCTGLPVENNLRYAGPYLVGVADNTLTSYSIKKGTKYIGSYAFDGCTAMNYLYVPDGVKSIGDCAFFNCSKLELVIFPNSVTSIGKQAFYECDNLPSITIPDGVTSIGEETFKKCGSLASFTVPDGVTSIGAEAFSGCQRLKSFSLPSSVTAIGNDAFKGCIIKNLSWDSDVSPESVTQYCKNYVENVILGPHVTAIPDYAFYQCTSLTSVVIPSSVETIGRSAFSGCTTLATVTLPEGMTQIGSNAFFGCTGLTALTIPSTLAQISSAAFYGCSGLTTLTLPEGVTTIGDYACYDCTGLVTVTLPRSMTTIGDEVFERCHALTDMTVRTTTPPSAKPSMMNAEQKGSVTLHVPATALDAYETHTAWSGFHAYAPIAVATCQASAGAAWTELSPLDGTLAIDDTWTAFDVQEEWEVATVTYSRKFGTDKWQSLYLPFDMAVADFEDKFDVAYVNNFVQYDRNSDGETDDSYLEIVPLTSGILYANYPYFIRAHQTADTPQIITFHNVTLQPTATGQKPHVESVVSSADFGGTFTPIDKAVVVAEHLFLVSGGKWTWLNQPVKCFRTYMKIASKSSAFRADADFTVAIRVMGETYDDDATGIGNVDGNGNVNGNVNGNDGGCYDLQGRRVDTPQARGIYIVNGRKTLVR